MSAVAGLLSVQSAQTNDLVGEFQETIFIRNSKGIGSGSTLFALMARLAVEQADNTEFNWWERDPVRKTLYSNAAATDVATTLTFDDGSGNAVWQLLAAGHVLRNDNTGEYVLVTATPSDANVTVKRDFANGPGDTTGVAITDNDVWTIITLGKDEGALPTRASYEEPELNTNYIQTFNSTVEVTNAFKGSVLRTDIDGPLRDRRIQALERISRDIEMAFLMGVKMRNTGTNGYEYFTGGIYDTLNQAGLTDNILNGNGGTGVTLAVVNAWLESFMTVGSEAKLALCGPKAYRVFSDFANSATNGYRIMQSETVFGMHIVTINTPFGELSLAYHPLLREATALNDWMFVVDLQLLVQKSFEPLFLEPNIQTPGQDSYKEQYRAKLGLKQRFPNAFGVAYDFSKMTLT